MEKLEKDCTEIDGEVHKDLIQLSEENVTVRSHDRMSRKFKQVAKGFAGKLIPSKERLFQRTSSSNSGREALLRVRRKRPELAKHGAMCYYCKPIEGIIAGGNVVLCLFSGS
ncbi:hypothetical protein U9M48_011596 [Paspalum notatum var. saurae]|uniref:Uncharacterized protein n=1 Tax=Paspalum notatum var. saurae TaxID=547442 RepID=A0AAQ3WHA0_PASNO